MKADAKKETKDEKVVAKKQAVEELSEEDRRLKEDIEYLVEKITHDTEVEHKKRYLRQLFDKIRAGPASRASVPKELRFLSPLYESIVEHFKEIEDGLFRQQLADFLSYASITLSKVYDRDSLGYYRRGTGTIDLNAIGSEYLLNLAGDLGAEYETLIAGSADAQEIVGLARSVVAALFKQDYDINAVDLLIEIERLDLLDAHIDAENYSRLSAYLMSYLEYCADAAEFEAVLGRIYALAQTQGDARTALMVALRVHNRGYVIEALKLAGDRGVRRQLAFVLGRHHFYLSAEELAAAGLAEDPQLPAIMSNALLKHFFGRLLRELEVDAPKRPQDVYKKMVEERTEGVDSALSNLGDSFVNALVNLGSGRETLFGEAGETPWVQRVKEAGAMSAVASLGLVYLWNFDEAQAVLAEYLDLKDGWARAGACVAVGLANSGVWSEADPAKALLVDALESEEPLVRLGAVLGLGLAYAGSGRQDFDELLMGLANDESQGIELCANAALALATVHAAECNADASESLLTSLTLFSAQSLERPIAKLFVFALGINCLGSQARADIILETVRALKESNPHFSALAEVVVDACAHVASGNVLKLQEFIEKAKERSDNEQTVELQTAALLGAACVAVSEPVGAGMVLRLVHHLLQYSHPKLRRAVPVMLFLVGVTAPSIQISELLYKLAFEEDTELALRAILALGLVFCGTNNTRTAELLRNVATYYAAEVNFVFAAKVALGAVFAGKGVVSINPFSNDRFLHSNTAFAGLLVTAFLLMNVEELLLKGKHYLLFYLSLAFSPKMLFCLDEELEELKVPVRVGQALDTVGQVGKPRRITGFQTFTSPVIVNNGERAELATEEYLPVVENCLENFLLLRKNADYNDKKI